MIKYIILLSILTPLIGGGAALDSHWWLRVKFPLYPMLYKWRHWHFEWFTPGIIPIPSVSAMAMLLFWQSTEILRNSILRHLNTICGCMADGGAAAIANKERKPICLPGRWHLPVLLIIHAWCVNESGESRTEEPQESSAATQCLAEDLPILFSLICLFSRRHHIFNKEHHWAVYVLLSIELGVRK